MGIIFLILAIIYLLRRPKIKQVEHQQYPHVPIADFVQWKRYELISIDIFLVCTFIPMALSLVAQIALATVPAPAQAPTPAWVGPAMIVGFGGSIVIFVIGLIFSASYGSYAAAIRKKYQIQLPR